MFESKSMHVMNIVTYIIYINEKQQNNKPIQMGIEFPTLITGITQ